MLKQIPVPFLIIAAILLTVSTGCNKKPTSTATGSINGTVSDSASGAVISSATVTTNPATMNVITNSSGQYTISNVSAGNYTVTAVKTTYYSKSVSVSVSEGSATTANFVLTGGAFVNNAPAVPSTPVPTDSGICLTVSPTLNWVCSDPDSGDTVKYDVYLGTTNPPTNAIFTNQNSMTANCGTLSYATTYYWKIVAKDNHGDSTVGAVWKFTTVSSAASSIEMVLIPAGSFIMGSIDSTYNANEMPQHTVFLDIYQISKYEITNAQYKVFMDAGGYSNSSFWTSEGWTWRTGNNITQPAYWATGAYNSGTAYPNHPVVGISWYEAYAFCKWAGGRLPTEAQWEKAARYTDAREYPWGDTWDPLKCNSYYNIFPDSFVYSSPVGSFASGQSAYGIYDLAGNAWEWVNDWYLYNYYLISPYSNPTGPADGTQRMLRGGSWNCDGSLYCRVADRYSHVPTDRGNYMGIRLAQ
jgi:formylglycine-generating enzyme required for sulfatase activity